MWRRPFIARRSASVRIVEQPIDRGAECLEVVRIVDKEPRLVVDHLIHDPADGGRDNRAGLPHRLRDRQSEAFSEALLHDDGWRAAEEH